MQQCPVGPPIGCYSNHMDTELRMNPKDRTSCTLYRCDWDQIQITLRELAQLKSDTLVNTNASDREWNEVVNLKRIADELEIELLTGVTQ